MMNQLSNGRLSLTRGSHNYDSQHSWLVKGLIPQRSFGVLYGAPDSFKSFTAIDIACSIATGEKYKGNTTKKGAVIYIAAEGQQGAAKRVKAWELKNNQQAKSLWTLGSSLSLSTPAHRKDLIEMIKQLEEQEKTKVELIVVDTLARCMDGDENSSNDMSEFVNACDSLREATDSSILCVHHSGKDVNKGARGSNTLLAAVDYEFKMLRSKTKNTIKLVNTKQKEADKLAPITLQYEPINLDIYCEDGLPVTSLVSVDSDTYPVSNSNGQILDVIVRSPLLSLTRGELNKALFPSKKSLSATERQRVKRELDKLVEKQLVTIDRKGKNSTNADLISIIH